MLQVLKIKVSVYNPHSSKSENEYRIKVGKKPNCVSLSIPLASQISWFENKSVHRVNHKAKNTLRRYLR